MVEEAEDRMISLGSPRTGRNTLLVEFNAADVTKARDQPAPTGMALLSALRSESFGVIA